MDMDEMRKSDMNSDGRLKHLDSVILSAYDDEESRVCRLQNVLKRLRFNAHLCQSSDLQFLRELHDHKGLLTVTWDGPPSIDEELLNFVTRAWEDEIEYSVTHRFIANWVGEETHEWIYFEDCVNGEEVWTDSACSNNHTH